MSLRLEKKPGIGPRLLAMMVVGIASALLIWVGFLSCRRVEKQKKASTSQAVSWFEEARLLSSTYSRTSWEKGREKAQAALAVFQTENRREKVMAARFCLGDLYLSLQKPCLALDVLADSKDRDRQPFPELDRARIHLRTGRALGQLEQYEEAVTRLERARRYFEKTGDVVREITALQYLANYYWYAKRSGLIPSILDRAMALSRDLNDSSLVATTLFYRAVYQQRKGANREAMDIYRSIIGEINRAGNRLIEAKIMNNLGILYNSVGEPTKGLANLEKAAVLFQEMGHSTQGACYMNMGRIYTLLGERGQAFTYLERARTVYAGFSLRQAQASVLYFLGKLYEETGDYDQAYTHLQQALAIFREVGSTNPRILVHLAMAEVLLKKRRSRDAQDHLHKALGLAARHNSLSMMGQISEGLGKSSLLLQDYPEAVCHFETALAIHKTLGRVSREAMTLYNLSEVHLKMNRTREAERYAYDALSLFREIGQRQGEAAARHILARIQQKKGFPALALETNNAALDILESLRAKITGSSLRTHFSASIHDLYDFKIDLLVRLSETRQNGKLAIQAFETTERARAQSLLELLENVTPGDDPATVSGLRKKKQECLNDLNGKSLYRMRLIQRGRPLDRVDDEIDQLIVNYRRLGAELDNHNPRYAHLSHLGSGDLTAIRNRVLDRETMLLEYALGKERGYFFLVSRDDFRVFPLPSYAELEYKARTAYHALTVRSRKVAFETLGERTRRIETADSDWARLSRELSDILIGPALPFLKQKRLLIVAEDALQFLPFSALPNPNRKDSGPLILDYEIVTAPSARVLLFLARERESKRSTVPRPASRSLAIFADPVFESDDPRFKDLTGLSSDRRQVLAMAQRDSGWKRLVHTRREVRKLLEMVPSGKILVATGFDATREAVLDPGLADYQIVHFATHGVMDARRPELSGLVFSLFDQQGAPRCGFLSQGEIFQLKLNADLVVLSACQTALGQEIKGEGMVGITQGFMYAGAPMVIASLWSIQDEATADFMALFYNNLFQKEMTPTAALRQAQCSLWQGSCHRSPYYWGAFIAWGLWDQGSK